MNEADISKFLSQMKEFEMKKAQEEMNKKEDKRFRALREQKSAEKEKTTHEQKTSTQEKRELVRHVRERVIVLVERMSSSLARMKILRQRVSRTKQEQVIKETPRYPSYEEEQEAIRARYHELCEMGFLAKEEDLPLYAIEMRVGAYYKRKADLYSRKSGISFRDFAIPTQEEIALLDSEVSDEEMLLAQRDEQEQQAREIEQMKIEEARREVMRRASELDGRIFDALEDYQKTAGCHEQYQPTHYEYARLLAQSRTRYEQMRESELRDLEKIETILEKRKWNEEDIRELQAWMDVHREFGLAEMSDEEYFDLFSDGRFYWHNSNFFRTNPQAPEGNPERMNGPRFFEALKDGYLIGRSIGELRGEPMSRDRAAREAAVFFDSNLDLNNLRRFPTHILYGLARTESGNSTYNFNRLPPVIAVAPARLLEAHSVKEPRKEPTKDTFMTPVGERGSDNSVGVGEGDAFGSGNPDVMSTDHNIDLGLFVLLLPKVIAKKEFIESMLISIIEDPRFARTAVARLAKAGFKVIPEDGVDLEVFMRDVFSRAIKSSEKRSIQIPSLPRLHFYEVSIPQGEDIVSVNSVRSDVINGFQQFLERHKIMPSVNEGSEKDQTAQAYLPEQYRISRSRLENVASTIRKRLQSLDQKSFTLSLAQSRESAEKLSFTRDELNALLDGDSYSPEALIALFEQDFGSEYAKDVGAPEISTLREHTLRVLKQFDRYFGGKPLPGDVAPSLFRVLLALHDIGEPRAVERGDKSFQYVYTQYMTTKILEQLRYTPREIALAQALVSTDCIGQYMERGDTGRFMEHLLRFSRQTNIPIKDLFALLATYYKVVAGSYGQDAGGKMIGLDELFIFDHENGEIRFRENEEQHLGYLEKQVEWEAGQEMSKGTSSIRRKNVIY